MPYDELVTYTGHSSGGPYQLTMIGLKVKNKLQQEWVDFYYDWVRDLYRLMSLMFYQVEVQF